MDENKSQYIERDLESQNGGKSKEIKRKIGKYFGLNKTLIYNMFKFMG